MPHSAAHRELRGALLCAVGLLASQLTGCFVSDLFAVRRSQRTLAERGFLGGTVEAANAADTWMVVDHSMLQRPGRWFASYPSAAMPSAPSRT